MPKKSWNLSVLESVIRTCHHLQNKRLTRKALIKSQMGIIVKETQCTAEKPTQSLTAVLINLKAFGILKQVTKGVYELSSSDEMEMKKVLKDSRSSGEKSLANLLMAMGINFTDQHTFPWLKFRSLLRVDSYFEIGNTKIVIEVDGPQHYHEVPFFGGEKTFAETVLRDNIKNQLLPKHDINLIRISDAHIKTDDGKEKLLDTIYDIAYGDDEAKVIAIEK